MKRSILLALFAALALAVGFGSVAIAAGESTAHAAKKGKRCKGKKGKGKAGKSATATAQAKKKGKGCKPKKAPKGSDGLSDGRFVDAANGVELNLSSSGKLYFASVKFEVPEFCALFVYESSRPTPAKSQGSGIEVRESGTAIIAGIPFDTSVNLSVTGSLSYSLTAEVKPQSSSLSCQYSGTIKGTLVKS